MELKAAVITIVGMVLLATPTLSRPDGAPTSSCSSMTPGFGTVSTHGEESTLPLPYIITVSATKYNAGNTITVTVAGSNFMGILMQVRKPGADTAYGKWSSPAANTKLKRCNHTDDSITHANTNAKQDAVFTWTAPHGVTDDLEVIATVAQEYSEWWKGVKSATLTHDASLPTGPTPTTAPSMSTCIGLSTLSMFLAICVALLTLRFY